MKLTSILLVSLLLAVRAFAGEGGEKKAVHLEIKGMTCIGCALMIEKSVKNIEGVDTVKVSFKRGAALVRYNPEKVNLQSILSAVEKAGGTQHLFKATPAAPDKSPEKR